MNFVVNKQFIIRFLLHVCPSIENPTVCDSVQDKKKKKEKKILANDDQSLNTNDCLVLLISLHYFQRSPTTNYCNFSQGTGYIKYFVTAHQRQRVRESDLFEIRKPILPTTSYLVLKQIFFFLFTNGNPHIVQREELQCI